MEARRIRHNRKQAAMKDFNEMTVEEHEAAIRELEIQQAEFDALIRSELASMQTTLERQIMEALTHGGLADALATAMQLVAVERVIDLTKPNDEEPNGGIDE